MAAGASAALLLASSLLPAHAPAAPTQTVSAAAPAGYEINTNTHDVNLAPGETFSTLTNCSGGKQVIGGGASLTLEPGSAQPALIGNGPNARNVNAWTVQYVNLGTSTARVAFKTWAFCVDSTVDFERPQSFGKPITLQPGSTDTTTLNCPSGFRPVGGGPEFNNTGAAPLTLIKNSSHGTGCG